MDSVLLDLRFAVRHFMRRPLSAATIVVVLALGIGAHTALFAVLQAFTLRPAPGVPLDDALVRIRPKEHLAKGSRWYLREVSYADLRDLTEERATFAAVAGVADGRVTLAAGRSDAPTVAGGQFVTSNFFRTLGVPMALGPGLPPNERADQGDPELVAVIGYNVWTRVFSGATDVIGRTMLVNDVSVQIVGVAPRRFNGAIPTSGALTVWLPLSTRPVVARGTTLSLISRDSLVVSTIVARLQPGVSLDRATSVAGVVSARGDRDASSAQRAALNRTMPQAANGPRDADVVLLRGDTELPPSGGVLPLLAVGGTMALLILIVACTNVSALVVGAAVARRQEIAVRLSLGASRRRVIRQLLTESTLLASLGGAFGLLLFWWITRLIATQTPDIEIAPDWMTITFTVCFALGTGILFGLSPALHATRRGVADVLKDSGTGATKRSRLQSAFVVAQIAFTQPLLLGLAMLLAVVLHDVVGPSAIPVAERVVNLRLSLFSGPGSSATKAARVDAVFKRIAAMRGVAGVVDEAAGAGSRELTAEPACSLQRAACSEQQSVSVHFERTQPGYFALIGVPIVRGRELNPSDSGTRDQAVVIGSDLARELWGAADPIGRRLTQHFHGAQMPQDAVVVGVFDARVPTTRGGQGTRIYGMDASPIFRMGNVAITRGDPSVLIRTTGPAEAIIPSIRSLLRAEVGEIPVMRLETLAQIDRAARRVILQVSGAAAAGGVLALLLASIGLYAVVALAVGQRRREIGIRVALGAHPRQVVAMFFGSGVRLSVIGLALGLPLSMIALTFIAAQAGIPKTSMPLTGAAIAVVVLGVASLATWVPARRAAGVNPVEALRSE